MQIKFYNQDIEINISPKLEYTEEYSTSPIVEFHIDFKFNNSHFSLNGEITYNSSQKIRLVFNLPKTIKCNNNEDDRIMSYLYKRLISEQNHNISEKNYDEFIQNNQIEKDEIPNTIMTGIISSDKYYKSDISVVKYHIFSIIENIIK